MSNFTAVYLERREGEVIKRLFPGKAHLGEQYISGINLNAG